MILTVEEAKTKWCPYYQVSTSVCGEWFNRDIQDNRGTGNERGISNYCKCVADSCMAWREITYTESNGTYYPSKGKGYCGFVGKPERE